MIVEISKSIKENNYFFHKYPVYYGEPVHLTRIYFSMETTNSNNSFLFICH